MHKYHKSFPTRRSSDLSSFNQMESNSQIIIASGQGAETPDLYFDPAAAISTTGSGFIIGDDTATPEQAIVNIYAGKPLNRSEEYTSELQSRPHLVCRLL